MTITTPISREVGHEAGDAVVSESPHVLGPEEPGAGGTRGLEGDGEDALVRPAVDGAFADFEAGRRLWRSAASPRQVPVGTCVPPRTRTSVLSRTNVPKCPLRPGAPIGLIPDAQERPQPQGRGRSGAALVGKRSAVPVVADLHDGVVLWTAEQGGRHVLAVDRAVVDGDVEGLPHLQGERPAGGDDPEPFTPTTRRSRSWAPST